MSVFEPRTVNLRLPAYKTSPDEAILMQNFDFTHQEIIEQINGSVKYHGATLGTNAPTAILVNYNDQEDKQDVLVACDDKILKKNFGANEFTELLSGLTPNKLRHSVNIRDKSYLAHPDDGLFEYDGISTVTKLVTNSTTGESITLKDIITAKETNRCFGITSNNELVWTDDLVDLGGVPIQWAGLNIDTQFPTNGDQPEKLFILSGRLIVLRSNSIWFYYILGSPSQWRPEKVDFSGGCIAPLTAKQVGKEIWFLGYSGETGRGVYALNGNGNVRLISYDVEPFLNRINYHKIKDAVAEHVDNLYKISFAIDASPENNYTFHFDTININKETGSPNIYGPHTYGFSCSAILNTTKFRGEHLFGRKHTDGARVFKVADYRSQYSDELEDNGDLIVPVCVSPILSEEQWKNGSLDHTWVKRYSNILIDHPPMGNWPGTLEILKGFENETSESYEHFMEGENDSLSSIDLGSDPVDFESHATEPQFFTDFESDAIQFKLSNYQVKRKMAFRSVRYDAQPTRRKKYVPIIQI